LWKATVENWFETQESFTVWGFPTAAGAWQFMDIWENEELQDGMKRRTAERAERELARWGAARGTPPGKASDMAAGQGR